jgi:hypothetical protein
MHYTNKELKANTTLPLTIRVSTDKTIEYIHVSPDDLIMVEDIYGQVHNIKLIDITDIGFATPSWEEYINSPEWKWRKEQFYKTHPKVCYCCGSTENVQLHHTTYDHLGCEFDNELEPLCERCHSALHKIKDIAEGSDDPDCAIEFGVKHTFPPCIGGHKTHLARVIAITCGYTKPNRELIPLLRALPKKKSPKSPTPFNDSEKHKNFYASDSSKPVCRTPIQRPTLRLSLKPISINKK